MAAKTSWKNYVTDFPTAEKFARGEGSSDTRRWIITVGSTQLREPVRSLAVRKELHEILTDRQTEREAERQTNVQTDIKGDLLPGQLPPRTHVPLPRKSPSRIFAFVVGVRVIWLLFRVTVWVIRVTVRTGG